MKKNNIFNKTKRKVIALSTAIVFICLIIFAFIIKTLYSSIVFNNIDRELIKQKVIFSEKQGDYAYATDRKPMFKVPPIPPNFIVAIHEGEKILYLRTNAYFQDNDIPKIDSSNKVVKVSFNGYEFRAISFKDGDMNIEFLVNVDSEIESINQLMNSIIISLLVLIIIALILAYFLSSKIIKPVKEAYEKQVFFVQDASHEMRTPLAVIKGKLEILTKNLSKENKDSDLENISKIMGEVRSLEKLNSDLLLLSKEDVEENLTVSNIDLREFVDEVSEFYFDLADMQEKIFEVHNSCNDIKVNWDIIKIKRIFIILIENAFKYTESGDKVVLKVEEANKFIKVTIKDSGIGIKEEDQKRIFDRFFRSSDVRGKNISGSGIGLSLLKSICKTLKIKINFTSTYDVGTEFQLLILKDIK